MIPNESFYTSATWTALLIAQYACKSQVIVELKMENHESKNVADLFEFVRQEWFAVTAEQCQKLVEMMPRIVAAVIKNKGYAVKYGLLFVSCDQKRQKRKHGTAGGSTAP